MKLLYWDGPNFGDQLNPFLFKKLLPRLMANNSIGNFYGIGTIIDDKTDFTKPNIFFGTGVREPLAIPSRLKELTGFVRGPLSWKSLHEAIPFITDGAYALPLIQEFSTIRECSKKIYDISIIPHFSNANALPWKKACELAGINLIHPSRDPLDVITQIFASKRVIAGAMHGAILADICRVPWLRLRMSHVPTESLFVTELKWLDWLLSLNLGRSDFLSLSYVRRQQNATTYQKIAFLAELLALITFSCDKLHFRLSSDRAYQGAIERINDVITLIEHG